MTNKVIITKTGFNATTETDPNNMVFSSDYNTLKYYLDGNTSLTIIGNSTLQTATTDVSHNLGYYPFFRVFCSHPDYSGQYNRTPMTNSTPITTEEVDAYLTNTNTLRLRYRYDGSSTRTIYFYYKIFKNNLNL